MLEDQEEKRSAPTVEPQGGQDGSRSAPQVGSRAGGRGSGVCGAGDEWGAQRKEEKRKEDQQGAKASSHTRFTRTRGPAGLDSQRNHEQKHTLEQGKGRGDAPTHTELRLWAGRGPSPRPPCTASLPRLCGVGAPSVTAPSPRIALWPSCPDVPTSPGGLAPICGGNLDTGRLQRWGWKPRAATLTHLVVHELEVDPFEGDLQQAPFTSLHVLHGELATQFRPCGKGRALSANGTGLSGRMNTKESQRKAWAQGRPSSPGLMLCWRAAARSMLSFTQ